MFKLEDTYNQAIRVLRDIVEDIRFGRKLYFDPIEKCSIQICKHINDDREILTLLNSVQDKNPYLYSHSVNVAFLSLVIGKWMELEHSKLLKLVRAGLIHDIGKAKIKDSLLNKFDTLTLEEMEKLKSHPVLGYKMLVSVNLCDPEVLQGVLFHHERMDGSGYPLGIDGEKIHLFARILAIADTFDEITASKTYLDKSSPLQVVKEIQESSTNLLDSNICQIFIKNMIEN